MLAENETSPDHLTNSPNQPVILVNPGIDLHELTSKIEHLIANSPNAAEFMGKYRSKDISESVREITVKWAAEGRDSRVFVKETLVTEENIEPVLRMMAVGVGKDVFDVKVKVQEKKTEERKAAESLKGGGGRK